MTIPTDHTSEAPADDIRPTISIYTDGACSNNGQSNPQGGWGAVLMNGTGRRLKIAGKLQGDTITNNRAELMAVIKALEALKRPARVELTTDSEYVQKGATEWLSGWKRRGWKTASKAPVKNADLWRRIDALLQTHAVRFHWVRGHDGHPENELADSLAVAGAEGASIREYGRAKAPAHSIPTQ
ncbi:ribonuclease HI [Halomonas elongata]|uniref:ribonuclease HI n=1 Tax=Halomonas elongata TaxID=2746 RepID=UPI0023AEFB98|nr:ribonuclease HI [Halomonas elongata]